MPLDAGLPACAEVLHYPLAPEAAAGACSGQFVRVGTAARGVDDGAGNYARLPEMRAAQRERIDRRYSTARDWLGRHQTAF